MLGPIVHRELSGFTRRWREYSRRCGYGASLLVFFALNYFGWRHYNGGHFTIRQAALFGQTLFGIMAAVQIMMTLVLVPELVAKSLAGEREKRTLPDLLTTRLTSAEIVLGKLAAALTQFASHVLVGVPAFFALHLLGGIDLRLVALLYAACGSLAVFVGGLTALMSTSARTIRRAAGLTMTLVSAWLTVPFLARLLMSFFWPGAYGWIRPVNEFFVVGNPLVVALGLAPVGFGRGLVVPATLEMIAQNLALGALFTAVAILRVRRAARVIDDEGRGLIRRLRRPWRLWRKPAVYADPMIWKELHTRREGGIVIRVVGLVVGLFIAFLVAWGTLRFAAPALFEVLGNGYGTTHDDRRVAFNFFLRYVSVIGEFLLLLMATGMAAVGIVLERSRETWTSLLATPMEGRQVLRAKQIGAVWRVRVLAAILLGLWTLGLLAGAVHPLGWAASVALLATSLWAVTWAGVLVSLVSRDQSQASNTALVPVLVLALTGFVPFTVPTVAASIWLGAASSPLMATVGLLSYRDLVANGAMLAEIGLNSGESTLAVAAAYHFHLFALVVVGIAYRAVAVARFDAVVGRPMRSAQRDSRSSTFRVIRSIVGSPPRSPCDQSVVPTVTTVPPRV
jgi:ABC-type transport system involved in multi-copper enzyme maturation permease subunit